MKQNAIFQLRAAEVDMPLEFNEDYQYYDITVQFPLPIMPMQVFYPYDSYNNGTFDALRPFEDNCYTYYNFVFNLTNMTSDGLLDAFADYYVDGWYGGEPLWWTVPPPSQFTLSDTTTNGTAIPALLNSTNSGWLASGLTVWWNGNDPYGNDNYYEVANELAESTNFIDTMDGSVSNLYGLTFLSTELAWGNSSPQTALCIPATAQPIMHHCIRK